ncbi:hypothetical protein, partial [Enterobacter cloacae complex sp. 2DZ2F20B]|uniref:hypothetical protein n=1 Tax=Enterobacter cloacae complex sp. 2DZ2F20B TaxID=2511993 RepID=UPI001CA4FF21
MRLNNIILIGDFNIPNFNDIIPNKTILRLQTFAHFLNLNQINNIFNSNNKLLDLAFSNIQW